MNRGVVMAQIDRFEEIEAWKTARELAREIYQLTASGLFAQDYPLRDQIRKAAISIMSNIAEGFGRGGNKEFIQFLSIARGSIAELQSQLFIALDAGYLTEAQYDSARKRSDDAGKLLSGFIRYLSQAHFKGSKYQAL
jgi:four helix bundle protein